MGIDRLHSSSIEQLRNPLINAERSAESFKNTYCVVAIRTKEKFVCIYGKGVEVAAQLRGLTLITKEPLPEVAVLGVFTLPPFIEGTAVQEYEDTVLSTVLTETRSIEQRSKDFRSFELHDARTGPESL